MVQAACLVFVGDARGPMAEKIRRGQILDLKIKAQLPVFKGGE